MGGSHPGIAVDRYWIKSGQPDSDFSALNIYLECVRNVATTGCSQHSARAAAWYAEYIKRIMWTRDGVFSDVDDWRYWQPNEDFPGTTKISLFWKMYYFLCFYGHFSKHQRNNLLMAID